MFAHPLTIADTDTFQRQRRVERVSQGAVQLPVYNADVAFRDARATILDWLRERTGRPLTDAMLRGETDSLDLPDAQLVETIGLADPRLWAARQEFLDPRVPGRTWVTEAMLAAPGGPALLLGFRLHCVTAGEPAPFTRSVPRFMRTLADSFDIRLDRVDIEPDATPVETAEEVDALVALLADPRRRMPVVGISMEDTAGGEVPLVDAHRLAGEVFATAHVRLLSRAASFRLTERIGKRLSVFNGAVRIWWAPLQSSDDPYNHPLWLGARILDEGAGFVRGTIVETVLRASAARRDADEAVPSFAEARRIASTLSRATALGTGRPSSEMLALYEAEVTRLMEQINEEKAYHVELLSMAAEDLRTVTAERDAARAEVDALRIRLDEMAKALGRRDEQPDVTIPDGLEGLRDWAQSHLGHDVEVLPRALNAAKKSLFDDPSLAYRALLLLRDAYVPLRRGDRSAKERWEAGLRRLGLHWAPVFSGPRAGEHASDYRVTYQGREVEIDMHLKGGNSRDPRYCFRLYFFWSEESRRVVVAWLPSHLPTRIS